VIRQRLILDDDYRSPSIRCDLNPFHPAIVNIRERLKIVDFRKNERLVNFEIDIFFFLFFLAGKGRGKNIIMIYRPI